MARYIHINVCKLGYLHSKWLSVELVKKLTKLKMLRDAILVTLSQFCDTQGGTIKRATATTLYIT